MQKKRNDKVGNKSGYNEERQRENKRVSKKDGNRFAKKMTKTN